MAQRFNLTSRVYDFMVSSSKGAVTLYDQEREHSQALASVSELSETTEEWKWAWESGVLTPGRMLRQH